MANVAHLVFIPAPAIGHIKSAIEIAKLLVNRDQRLTITFLIIKPPTLTSGSGVTAYFDSLSDNIINRISFVELVQDDDDASHAPVTFGSINQFIKGHCKYVSKAVAELVSEPGSGRLAGFVVDMFCTCMTDVANEFNVPTYVFFPSSGAFLGFKLYIETLHRKIDLVELTNSDTEVSVPAFVNPLPSKVLWSDIRTRDGAEFALSSARKLREVKGIIVNSCSELESRAFEWLSSESSIPTVYPVGPILNLEGESGKPLIDHVIRWLDSQPPSSVVLLCFGSMGSFDDVQVKEIARALEQSGHRFVWSLRRPPSADTSKVPSHYQDLKEVLPEGFLERTDGFGKVIGWAPQVALLDHPSVGGFVSHCGWNSLLESVWFGVPVATWPMYAEQQMNAFEMVVELGLAVDIKLDYVKEIFNPTIETVTVTADEIESGIRRLMEDKEVRKKVKEMSVKSRAAVAEGGSSYTSVGNLIQDFIRNIS